MSDIQNVTYDGTVCGDHVIRFQRANQFDAAHCVVIISGGHGAPRLVSAHVMNGEGGERETTISAAEMRAAVEAIPA